MREFNTAVAEVEDELLGVDDDGMEFSIDGVLCRAYKPNDGQLAVVMAMTSRHSSEHEQVAGIINFFVNMLDEESQTYVVNRLFDRRDKFGIEEVREIMEGLIEDWSGFPTKQSPGSTPSRKNGGQRSKPRTTKSISSVSPTESS